MEDTHIACFKGIEDKYKRFFFIIAEIKHIVSFHIKDTEETRFFITGI